VRKMSEAGMPGRVAIRAGRRAAGCALAVALSVAAAAPPGPAVVSGTRLPGQLTGVSAASASDAWAVGYGISHAEVTLALRWNGTSWARTATPSPGGSNGSQLNGVSAASGTDAWAVGSYATGLVLARTLALHWDGTRWTPVPTPSPGTGIDGAALNAVTVLSPADAWAVGWHSIRSGAGEVTLIMHWNGARWAQVPSPSPGGSQGVSALGGVTAVSASDMWAVGSFQGSSPGSAPNALVLHWNGARWAQVPSHSPAGSGLGGVTALSATRAWAVGQGPGNTPLVLRWNGTRWAPVPSPAPRGSLGTALGGVSATSASDAWAVGVGLTTLVLHWNGTSWVRPG
jgi:hypothetical protein